MTLPHDKGLGGHSDGDVLLHAITDALLGAIAGPDIGSLFPPSDPQWKNADSAVFLREALKRVKAAGYELVNLDSTLILSTPKIGPTPARFANTSPNCAEFQRTASASKPKHPKAWAQKTPRLRM